MKNTDHLDAYIMVVIGALIVGFILGAWLGVTSGIYQRDAIRKQALDRGFATWVSSSSHLSPMPRRPNPEEDRDQFPSRPLEYFDPSCPMERAFAEGRTTMESTCPTCGQSHTHTIGQLVICTNK